jgi:hypothetical protein
MDEVNGKPRCITIKVLPEGDYWVGLVQDVPDFRGGVTGDTLTELHAEVEAVKHFALGVPKEADVAVEYEYEIPGVATDVLDSYRQLRRQREEVAAKLSDAALAAVGALRTAGMSVRDSAALLGISRSRIDQLSR